MQNNSENARSNAAQLLSLIGSHQQFDWRHYWFMIWRGKWWIIVPTSLITSAGIAYALLFIRPVYEAAATIQVAPSRLLNRSVQSVTPGATGSVDYNELRRSLLSTNYLTELIHRLDLINDEKAVRAAKQLQARAPAVPYEELLERAIIQNLRRNINVESLPNSEFFQISARHESPQLTYLLVKTLTEIFIDESKRNELRGIRGVMEFSNEQLSIYRVKVEEAEKKLQSFKERLAASQAKRVGLSPENIAKLRELVSSCEIAISDRQRRVAQLEKEVPAKAQRMLWNHDPDLQRVKARINGKLANFKKSASMSTLQTSYEITLNNDINLLRQECQRLLIKLIVRLYPDVEAAMQQMILSYQMERIDLYILNARVEIAEGLLNSFVEMAAAAPAEQLELQRLEDELEQNRRIFKLFADQERGSRIEEALQHSDAEFKYSVFESAHLPIHAVSGSKRKFVSLCFGAGLAFGVALIFVREFLNQSIRSVEDVENLLQIAVWGIIPKISAPFNKWHRGFKKSTAALEARSSSPAGTSALPIEQVAETGQAIGSPADS